MARALRSRNTKAKAVDEEPETEEPETGAVDEEPETEEPETGAVDEEPEAEAEPVIQKFTDPLTGEEVFRVNGVWYESEIEAKSSLHATAAAESVKRFLADVYGEPTDDEDRSAKRARTQAQNFATQFEKWRLAMESEGF